MVTSEKDAPAEMPVVSHEAASGETQAALCSTAATQAPAEMPGEEEMLAAYNAVWQGAPSIDAHNVDTVRREALSAVRALFAPVLAEKERQYELASEGRAAFAARALAAKAALAKIEDLAMHARGEQGNRDSLKAILRIAAAIRAQGE